ncbi:ABC transporter permease subunit [Microbacterium betulae]|uniref:ABC transporter permease subunit n=1 Tax=Microbacterium betulae TaxID=2981139 RepID=A0AA97FJB5_9MICO|nr:ABC transporter permease subunit [Microbacterium sp. AB]WOF24323.1 ABC transporter permease subunit [Microbacterium sp. AB]
MNLLLDAFAWLLSPERLEGSSPLPRALLVHLAFTFGSVAIAAVVAIPAGWLIGHTGRGRGLAVSLAGAARAVPSFGLILLLVLLLGVLHKTEAAVIAFVLLAIPSVLAGAYTGIDAIDRRTIDAARATGMSEWQILWRVEAPLGLPLLVGGLRAAVLQVVATVTLAAYVNLGGLGFDIIQGIQLRRFDQVLGGAIVVAALALALDAIFAVLQRASVPAGIVATTPRGNDRAPRPRRAREKEALTT